MPGRCLAAAGAGDLMYGLMQIVANSAEVTSLYLDTVESTRNVHDDRDSPAAHQGYNSHRQTQGVCSSYLLGTGLQWQGP